MTGEDYSKMTKRDLREQLVIDVKNFTKSGGTVKFYNEENELEYEYAAEEPYEN